MRRLVAAGASALAAFFAVFLQFAFSTPPVRAADLSDLEERIAELEATTVRTGNRRFSLNLYGQVNRAFLFWNDGFDSDTFVVDNHASSTRLGFIGRSAIGSGWTAGYRFEFEAFPQSNEVSPGAGGAEGVLGTDHLVRIRQSYWEVIRKDLGRVSVGFQSPATDDITLINLGSQMNDAAVHYNNAFPIRLDLANPPIVTDLTWGQIAHNVDSMRDNFVRYDTPILHGLLLSTAKNDDVWDVALRYQNATSGFRFAAGLGYMNDRELRFEDVRGSASLIHDATGLYASVAGGWRNAARAVPVDGDDAHFHYAQLGISKQWLAPGKTTFYIDHGVYKNFNVGDILSINPDTALAVQWGTLVDTQVRRWGFGIEQALDAASMLVYAQAHFYDPRIIGFPCLFEDPNVCGGNPSETTKLPAPSWQGFVVGARIQF